MRVLLDATAIPPDRGGVGRYVEELIPEVAGLGAEVHVVAQARDVDLLGRGAADVHVVAAPPSVSRRAARLMWEQARLPALARALRPDVLHSPHYTMPWRSPVPVAVTLHDATFFTAPTVHVRSKAVFFRAATRHAVRVACALIVPSEATRDEVLRVAGGERQDFVVAPHGVDSEVFRAPSEADVARLRQRLALGDRAYVAFLGTLEPRKNVPALIRGWVAAAQTMGRGEAPALVLAGAPGWDPEVDRAAAAVPPDLSLVRAGYLPIEDLAPLLGGAQVVAYPSLGEGFGLPVVEAMASGSVVLTTRELSLPEVGGEAVAYTDTDAGSIARALGGLLRDPRRREELRAAALERSRLFTWRRAAERHLEAYERAMSSA